METHGSILDDLGACFMVKLGDDNLLASE